MWEGRALSQLYWDLGEWLWPHSDLACAPVTFFEYTVRIGRLSLLRQQREQPTCMRFWLHSGLSHAYLLQFWFAIWDLRAAWRISFFMWMLSHAGLVVGTWLATMGHAPVCPRSSSGLPESPGHYLWICSPSHVVWCAVCLLLSRAGVQHGFLTWGSVSWLMPMPGPQLFYEGSATYPAFMLIPVGYQRGTLDMIP